MHNNKQLNYLNLLLLALLILGSCKKSSEITYNEPAMVYFYKYGINADSLHYTFANKDVERTEDTVYLHFRIMGDAAEQDREVNLIVEDSSTAVQGVDFSFGAEVIHAGAFEDSIAVVLHKTAKLDTTAATIHLAIGASKDFKPGYTDNGINLSGTGSRLQYSIIMSNQLNKPDNWDGSLSRYFGSYSRVKFQFIISVSGITDWTSTPYPATLTFIVQQTKAALLQYKQDNGHPLLDEYNQEVTLP